MRNTDMHNFSSFENSINPFLETFVETASKPKVSVWVSPMVAADWQLKASFIMQM